MSSFFYFIKESLKGFTRNLSTALGSIVTIFLSLLIIGVFLVGGFVVEKLVSSVESEVSITAYVSDDASDADIQSVENFIEGLDGVASVGFTNKEQALEKFRSSTTSDIIDTLDGQNPLPRSIDVELSDPQLVEQVADAIRGNSTYQQIIGYDTPEQSLKYGQQTVDRLFTLTNYVRYIGIALVALLIFIAMVFINNTIRLKPKDNVYADGEVLAIVTIVTERYRTQYALLYTTRMQEAVTDKEIECSERNAYNNPAVSLSTADMTKYARQIWSSSAKYRNVATKMHRMVMRLNNIYSVGEYFFIDFSVENKTNIRFDIDEMRIKLSDKKQSKATNAQIVELTPSLVLDDAKTFKYGYRNVIVVKKMTFPNDKVLTIELSEKQISGRTISLSIDYEDVLSADSFNHILLEEE